MKIRKSWVYRKLSSIKTSILLLGILSIFYLLGSIFPQGGVLEEYIAEGGRFLFFVKYFGFLHIFSTPGFLSIAFLLFLNLTICSLEQFRSIIKQKKSDEVRDFSWDIEIPLPYTDDAEKLVEKAFVKGLRFRKKRGAFKDPVVAVLEKGFLHRILSLLYHTGVLVCFLGFFLSLLFAFEGIVTVYPDRAEPIPLHSKESNWTKIKESIGIAFSEEETFRLKLVEFTTEYWEHPRLKYMDEKLSRLAFALGWNSNTLQYNLTDDSFFPKDWKSRLKVLDKGKEVMDRTIEVNDPLTYKGYTFYQMGWEQRIKIGVAEVPEIEAETGKEFKIPELDGRFKLQTLRTGILFKKDGTKEEIKPFAKLFKKDRGKGWEEVGRLNLGERLSVNGKTISLKGFEEATVLSYRYDPGVTLLKIAGILTLIFMSLRIWGCWYMIAYKVERRREGAFLCLFVREKGLLAAQEKMLNRLKFYIDTMKG